MSPHEKATAALLWRVEQQPDVMIARVYEPKHPDGADYAPILETTNKGLAQLIVTAVNSHTALVEALQGTLSWLTSYPGEGAMGAYEQASEALRLAQTTPTEGGTNV